MTPRESIPELIRASLLATDWKSDFGYAVQVGVVDHVDSLNRIAEWLAEVPRQELFVVDPLATDRKSIITGTAVKTRGHFKIPPTMNGNVRLYGKLPDLKYPIIFLHQASDITDDAAIKLLRRGSVVMGSADRCRELLNRAQLTAQPLYACGTQVSIRIDTSA
jgi:hypothetical protein